MEANTLHTKQRSFAPQALVTGASSGIGEEFARQLAPLGFDLILAARRKDRLDALSAELSEKHGVNCESLAVDLAEENGISVVEERISHALSLEILVNNAGFGGRGMFVDTPSNYIERMIRVHCIATSRLARAALPAMITLKSGSIINVASVAGLAPSPGSTAYHATKAFIIALSEALHLEVSRSGVYVQALCPGLTYSEFHDVIGADRQIYPKSWWMTSSEVVSASLNEMHKRDARGASKGRVILVPGSRYKRIASLIRILPRSIVWSQSLKRAESLKKRRENLKKQ